MLTCCGEYCAVMPGVSQYTGCFIMIDKKFELIARARKQPISWDRCFFVD